MGTGSSDLGVEAKDVIPFHGTVLNYVIKHRDNITFRDMCLNSAPVEHKAAFIYDSNCSQLYGSVCMNTLYVELRDTTDCTHFAEGRVDFPSF
jgi:hypothetical protein